MNEFNADCKEYWDALKVYFDGIIDYIAGKYNGDWARAWKGIKEIFMGELGAMEARLNRFIDAVNAVILKMNELLGTDFEQWGNISFISDNYSKVTGGGSDTTDVDGVTGATGTVGLTDVGAYVNNLEATMLPGVMTQLDPDTQGTALTDYQTQKAGLNAMAQYYYNQSRSTGNINVNVYGAQGQDVQELAELVSQELQNMLDQEEGGLR